MLKPVKPVRNLTPGPALGPHFFGAMALFAPFTIRCSAAPDDYQLLYEDGHVRLLEVTVRPGETTPTHGHPYASVLAFDTDPRSAAKSVDTKLSIRTAPLNGQGAGHGLAPSIFNMTDAPKLRAQPLDRRLAAFRF